MKEENKDKSEKPKRIISTNDLHKPDPKKKEGQNVPVTFVLDIMVPDDHRQFDK